MTTTTHPTPEQIGTRVGAAIARDVLAEDMPRKWTGLDPIDGDVLISAGIAAGTPEWERAEAAAKIEYQRMLYAASIRPVQGVLPNHEEAVSALWADRQKHRDAMGLP
jgi:hypothetical protein